MYFILIDRFVDGDSSNNSGGNPESYQSYDGTNPVALKHYQGGDLAGITQSLDSIRALGITMIWISPFLDNSDTDYVGWWPYHGYHPIDFYAVDEHFGTLDDLKNLVATAHKKGLKIIFDMPFNQTAADHPWIHDPSKKDWYHWDKDGNPYEITDWQDQEQIERGELHGLPDLAQENPEVSRYLYDVSKYWIEETGCDGFRLDAVKHIPLEFWSEYNKKIKALVGQDFLLLGEVFWGEATRIQPYVDVGFDYLFDIPGYYAIRNTFNKGGSLKDFSEFYQTTEQLLGSRSLATLIDNHDVARFNVGLGRHARDKQMLALGWLMTTPGLPVIYYGTELGMPGFDPVNANGEPQDFLNRHPYPEKIDTEQAAFRTHFIDLTQLRLQHAALASGKFREVYQDWSVYAYLRFLFDEQYLVILNNASTAEFLTLPEAEGLEIDQTKRIYGTGVLRLEDQEIWLHLPPNSLTIWQFEGSVSDDMTKRVEFTDRLSRDYQIIRLSYYDKESKVTQLQIAGDFNNWIPRDYSGSQTGHTLFVDIPLKPGVYSYKLVLNGVEWIADPNASEYLTDPYGGRNSILTVDRE
ncbi:MAG: alpha-amylase family glycosyl hydrolase [Candidatus Marinimicrobia bacterium]|nr:alpha-amylase family glycosyl hydrolase [Candidatus Neomarinimicrobiota bacterium]